MNEQNEDKELQQKQEEQNATKDLLKTGTKAAATYVAPGIGSKVVDAASKIPALDKAFDKGAEIANRIPGVGKATNVAKKSGASDALDKVVDIAGGDVSGAAGSNLGGGLGNIGSSLGNSKSTNSSSSSSDSGDSNTSSSSLGDSGLGNKKMSLIPVVLSSVLPTLFIIIIFIVLFGSIMAPLQAAQNFVKGIWNNLVDWVSPSQQTLEKEYYLELKNVQEELNEKGICIDINLITASLTVGRNFDELLESGQEGVTEIDENGEEIPYKKMKKQVKLLANMQIMRKNYGLNSNLKKNTDYYCIDKSKKEYAEYETFQLVDSETVDYFYDTTFFNKDNGLDSSNYELIAKHDVSEFEKFFSKKINEEKNYAYYLYHPPFDEDGNCTDDYAEELLEDLPEDELEVSIGDYSTRKDSVYYWNLVNSFIPEYYKKDLPKNEPEKTNRIFQIADEIYLLYETIGPSKICGVSYAGPSNLCPNGITVNGVGTIDLEEYIAGVVSKEAYTSEGMEALKAQAVAARTYALKRTNYCQTSIQNSTNAQTFTRDINDRAREAANSTSGEVLIDKNGNIFSSQYDSFCYDDKDCLDSIKNSDGTYTVTYTKVPYGEKHTITLSDSKQYRRITHGQGHAHGMSQLVSYQLAKEGKNYKEILSYFYSDGVSISKLSPSSGGSGNVVAGGSAQQKLAYLFPAGLPSSSAEASTYMITVQFPTVDINGNRSTKSATVHKSIAQDFISIMTEIADKGFPIKDVGCYNWRSAAASTSRSHHSYGIACDLNVNENYMIKNGQVIAGSLYRPGDNPYSFPANGIVVQTFAKYGWGWGGSWNSSKDYMHFSFTNH